MIRRLSAAAFLLAIGLSTSAFADDVGKRFPSEKRTILDPVTKVPLTVLTSFASAPGAAPAGDAKLYQTHPQWSYDGKHIIFRSSARAAGRGGQAFAVNEATGVITQLTDGPGTGTGSLNVARRSNKLYYTRRLPTGRSQLIEADLGGILADSETGRLKPGGYERIVATLPEEHRESGGFTLDADEKTAYFGVRLGETTPRVPGQPIPNVPGGIRAVNLATGAYTKVIDTPFTMGHVQANPFVPGEIMYCHETGGDAPQRIWIVKADGSGNRPLFVENPTDWVTHEVFIDADHVMFNLMGHTPALRVRPTGIMIVNLRNNEVENVGQVNVSDGRSFWHSDGSSDGRWAAGDDFDGNLTLIDRKTGERRVLSAGHFMRPDHMHPNFSPDRTRIYIQSGMLSRGAKLDLMTVPIPAR